MASLLSSPCSSNKAPDRLSADVWCPRSPLGRDLKRGVLPSGVDLLGAVAMIAEGGQSCRPDGPRSDRLRIARKGRLHAVLPCNRKT